MAYDKDDDIAKRQVMPQTQRLGNRVMPSKDVSDPPGRYDPGASREDGAGVTSSVPVAAKRMSGNAAPSWPTTKPGSMMHYGKAPR